MICNSNGEDTAGQTGLEVTVPSSFQLKVAWHISRIDSSGTITAYSCPTFTKLSFITRGLSTTATNTVTAVRIGAVAVRGIKVTSTLVSRGKDTLTILTVFLSSAIVSKDSEGN